MQPQPRRASDGLLHGRSRISRVDRSDGWHVPRKDLGVLKTVRDRVRKALEVGGGL